MNIVIIDDDNISNLLTVKSVEKVISTRDNIFVYMDWENYLNNFDDSLPVSIFILDHNLPGLSGVEILKKLKKLHPESKFIVLSGQYEVSTAIEFFHLGVYNYIIKGIDSDIKLSNDITKIIETCKLNSRLANTQMVLLLVLSALTVTIFSIISFFISM